MHVSKVFPSLRDTLPRDLMASVVVFLVALPLCMGIAIASGMPPAKGLLTGIVGGLVVGFLAGSPLQVSGPAAGLAVLVFELVRTYGVAMLGPILLLAGAIQLLAGRLRLGCWFRVTSPAVVYGMLAGIGILIVLSHIGRDARPGAQGVRPRQPAGIPQAAFAALGSLGMDSGLDAALLGLGTIAVMWGWDKLRPATPALPTWRAARREPGDPGQPLAGAGRAAGRGTGQPRRGHRLATPGRPAGPWPIPPCCWRRWWWPSSPVRRPSARRRRWIACTTARARTWIASCPPRGVGNMLCGLLGALPMTGVIVRSSANVNAGARTRASAIFHGLWLLAFVLLLGSLLRQIPVASLAGCWSIPGSSWSISRPSATSLATAGCRCWCTRPPPWPSSSPTC